LPAVFLRFERLVHGLGHVALLASTVLIVYIMASQTLEVVLRTAGHPTTWVYDFNLSAIVGAVFLGLAGAERARDNVNVDFFTERLPARANRFLKFVNLILALLFLAILVWFGIAVVGESLHYGRTTGSLFPIPAALAQAALPLGGTLMALQVVVDLVRMFHPAPEMPSPPSIQEIEETEGSPGGPQMPDEVSPQTNEPQP
jgi:TRAP-type C4-dicarboxylate transport system, small permease component